MITKKNMIITKIKTGKKDNFCLNSSVYFQRMACFRDSESEHEDEDMDTLYRNYEILSEFYQKYYVDLRILDLTCDPVSVPAPTVNHGRVAKYSEVSCLV